MNVFIQEKFVTNELLGIWKPSRNERKRNPKDNIFYSFLLYILNKHDINSQQLAFRVAIKTHVFFRYCWWDWGDIYLVTKSNSRTEKKPSKDEHGKVHGAGSENHASQKEQRRQLYGDFPAKSFTTFGCKQTANHRREVERRCEKLEELIIEFTVIIFSCMVLFYVYMWKKLLQKHIHRCHTSYIYKNNHIN